MTLTGFVWLFTSSWNDPGLMTLSLTPTGLCSWKRVARLDQKSVWRYYFYWIRSDPGIPTKWKHWADLIVAGKATGRTARQVRESIGNLFPCWNSFAFHAEPQCWAAGTGTVENRTNCCIRWPVGSDWDEFGFFVHRFSILLLACCWTSAVVDRRAEWRQTQSCDRLILVVGSLFIRLFRFRRLGRRFVKRRRICRQIDLDVSHLKLRLWFWLLQSDLRRPLDWLDGTFSSSSRRLCSVFLALSLRCESSGRSFFIKSVRVFVQTGLLI